MNVDFEDVGATLCIVAGAYAGQSVVLWLSGSPLLWHYATGAVTFAVIGLFGFGLARIDE